MEKKVEGGQFDYKRAMELLKQMADEKDKVDVRKFHDLCKVFTRMSASMGSLVSWGFDGKNFLKVKRAVLYTRLDINDKCKFLMDHANNYTDCKYIHELVEKEMSLNLHVLSGSNGEKYGYKEGHPLHKYESASRTILRLLYFLTLLTHLLKNMKQYPEELMANIARKSYEDSIAQFHPPVLREAIKAAFLTIPSRKEFMESAFGVTDKKVFADKITELLKPLAGVVARIWKYYQEKKLTTLE